MDRQQQMVREFMQAVGQPTPDTWQQLRRERLKLRLDLILEEAWELVHASGAGLYWDGEYPTVAEVRNDAPVHAMDVVNQIDALCDLLYVTYGMAVEMGIDLEPFFAEVHAANMRKVGGPVREDGKREKPPGWRSPDLAAVFERCYGKVTSSP
jgi:predicted HAD superfamily Cof-like phosphohydrolase